MAGMVPHTGESLDDHGDSRQRPQVGAEAVRFRTRADRPLHLGQLRGTQPRLAARAPGAFEPRPAVGLPGVEPVMRTDPCDAQRLGHCPLRFAAREQPRGLQPTRLHRGQISCGRRHASACDRTCEIR
jgi:hypothetical protein